MCFTYFLVPSFTSSTPIYYASIPFRALVMVLGWLLRTRITLRTGLISSRSSRQWADLHSSHRILGPEPFTAEVGGARGGRGGAAWSSGCSGPGGLQMTSNLPNALRKRPSAGSWEGTIWTWPWWWTGFQKPLSGNEGRTWMSTGVERELRVRGSGNCREGETRTDENACWHQRLACFPSCQLPDAGIWTSCLKVSLFSGLCKLIFFLCVCVNILKIGLKIWGD